MALAQYSNETEIVQELINDLNFKFKNESKYLKKGICPNCGGKETFIAKDKPYIVKCSRQNKCGYTESTRDLYPHLFNNFAERFPKTEADPNATAKAYMASNRGFKLSMVVDWFEQGAYKLPESDEWVCTVRFYLDKEKTRWWERLIDKQKSNGQRFNFGGKRKADGSLYRGDWWVPPTQVVKDKSDVYLVEAIFHAIGLFHVDYNVAATLSAGTFPSDAIKPYLNRGITWKLGLDDDKAGRENMLKHKATLEKLGEKCEVLLTGDTGRDWDDLYRLKKITKRFMDEAHFQGRMFTAEDYKEKAFIFYAKRKVGNNVIEFENRFYSVKVDVAKLYEDLGDEKLNSNVGKDKFYKHSNIYPVSNCLPEFLFVEKDQLTNVLDYYFKVTFANGDDSEIVSFEAPSLKSASNLSDGLLAKAACATFDGSATDMRILKERWFNPKAPKVIGLPYIGYDNINDCYVFHSFAYKNGRKLELNEHGYFQLNKLRVKTNFKSFEIVDGEEFNTEWFEDFYTVFGVKGVAILAYWTASLFANQIRGKHENFPFLEITGAPGAGKTGILKFLWKLFGRIHEGFDPSKTSDVGRARALSQTSGLPVVLIESERDEDDGNSKGKRGAFDWDEFKTLYNGGILRLTGVKNNGSETKDLIFLGSLVISQNKSIEASEAIMTRIVHVYMDTTHHKKESQEIAKALSNYPIEKLSGYLPHCLKNEKQFLAIFDQYIPKYKSWIEKKAPTIKTDRIFETHSKTMAACRALQLFFPTLDKDRLTEVVDYLKDRAIARERKVKAEHEVCVEFWDTYELLNLQHDKANGGYSGRDVEILNHSKKENVIAINLKQFNQICSSHRVEMISVDKLKQHLPNSQRHKLIKQKTIDSAILGKKIWCWCFERKENLGVR